MSFDHKQQDQMKIQEEQSYEQIYEDNLQQQQQEDVYETELMLDQDDQIQIYAAQNQDKQSLPSQNQQNDLNGDEDLEDKDENSQIIQLVQSKLIKLENTQSETDVQEDSLKLQKILQTKYPHFDQHVLIKMLYRKLFSSPQSPEHQSSVEDSLTEKQQTRQTRIAEINERKDFEGIKRTNHTIKVFIEHGYGISVARKFSLKGEEILPNPYNNLIGKIIKETWKTIEQEVSKMRKSLKPLSTEQFNQIKTPLFNSKTWMKSQYLNIFNNVILYVHGLKSQKPSHKQFQILYDYLVPNPKEKKPLNERRFYKKKEQFNIEKLSDSDDEEKIHLQKYEELASMVKETINKTRKF